VIRFLLVVVLIVPNLLFAHGGGLNSSGCHNQTSSSTYHCHSGPLDGQSFSSQEAAQTALDALSANKAPTVFIVSSIRTVADTDGKVGEVVAISATVSDSDGTISSTEWLTNGQVIAVGTSVSLTLSDGVNTVTFRATDNEGGSSSASVSITVTSPTPNSKPVVTINGGNRTIPDSDNQAGESVSFSASIVDSDSVFLSPIWTVNGISSSTTADATLTLADGVNAVSLKVTDDDGAVGTDSVNITVVAPSNAFPEYNRSDYLTNWLDRDGDCVDTRDEVLMIESAITPTLSTNGCDVLSGLWNDPYTGRSFTNPSDLDVDHLVPLKEAHDSGAALWSTDRKREFANDLTTAHALIAVDLSANRSKGSRDPAAWLPTNTAYHCEYVRNWVDVKNKYGLTFDESEQEAIESVLGKTLTESSKSEILGVRSVSGDSSARFALYMTKNSECGYSAEAQTTDSVKLSVSITPEEPQLDKTFDVFLILSLNSQLLILSSTGELIPFTGSINDLVPFVDDIQLKQSLEFTLFNGVLSPAIDISLFVAYMTSDGEFIFTPTPLSLRIND
jgi:hypothetical protein